jgi:asparaginyl-tRNA synthetase
VFEVCNRVTHAGMGRLNATDLQKLENPVVKKYEEVIKELGLEFGADLKKEHEAQLTEKYGPIFVTHYPKEIKFFNMYVNREDPRVVDCVDFILPHSGETVGASIREVDQQIIKDQLHNGPMFKILMEEGGDPHAFDNYLELFNEQPVKRGGFGLGLGRLLQYIMQSDEIIHV